MPKDRERYRYVDVGLERSSWVLARFEEDARRHQMSDQPGKLVALRLTEYYELKQEREAPSAREIPSPVGNGRPALRPAYDQRINNNSVQEQADMLLELSHHATENADEAVEYWARL
jgi:hypothetical protein